MTFAYYNEIDPFRIQWLWELIKNASIPNGVVDSRPIQEVQPIDLKGFDQCHFFAGIAGWAYALRLAEWPAEEPVWTGSCPCQPFSVAGQHERMADRRHLWPFWFRLIEECRPNTVFGEQVATQNGRAWFDHVAIDMERRGYAVGACDSLAAYYGAPHRRPRLYFVGHSDGGRSVQHCKEGTGWPNGNTGSGIKNRMVADSNGKRLARSELQRKGDMFRKQLANDYLAAKGSRENAGKKTSKGWNPERPWENCQWLEFENRYGETEKRPVESGTLPMAYGLPANVGRYRGYGGAICIPQARAFIEAFKECMTDE